MRLDIKPDDEYDHDLVSGEPLIDPTTYAALLPTGARWLLPHAAAYCEPVGAPNTKVR